MLTPRSGVHKYFVSGSTDDDGFLTCARSLFRGPYHNSTQELVQHILASITNDGDGYFIVGHGAPGLQETGDGQTGADPTKMMTIWNKTMWTPLLQQLPNGLRGGYLQFNGCLVGLDQDGATFLSAVANVVGALVAAPTGAVSCNGTSLVETPNSPGGGLQIAGPGPAPAPINAPSIRSPDLKRLTVEFGEKIEVSSVTRVKVYGVSGRTLIREAEGQEAQEMSRALFSGPTYKLYGRPAAFHTATVAITYKARSKPNPQTLCVKVWDDRFISSLDLKVTRLTNPSIMTRLKKPF